MGVSPLLYIFPLNYHRIRNQVTHGNLPAERIDVSETIEEFFRIQSSLARDKFSIFIEFCYQSFALNTKCEKQSNSIRLLLQLIFFKDGIIYPA